MTFKEHFRTNFNIRLQIADSGTELVELHQSEVLKDFKAETNIFKFNQIEIKADPFLFVHNDTLFLFYEEKKRKSKGYIMMTSTKDLKKWTIPTLVLQEPFHLSFPFVFKQGNQCYLLPETEEAGEIRLYRFCDNALRKVEFLRTLQIGQFVDSSIIYKNGINYLFTSDSSFNQRVFVSENLLGDYIEHPSSPIYVGRDYGRNAGSIFEYGGRYYRPSQDCSHLYGGNVSIHLFLDLDTNSIKEINYLKDIFSKDNPYYLYGGHQLNLVKFRNKIIIATDALDLNFNIFKIIQKVLYKVFHVNV